MRKGYTIQGCPVRHPRAEEQHARKHQLGRRPDLTEKVWFRPLGSRSVGWLGQDGAGLELLGKRYLDFQP